MSFSATSGPSSSQNLADILAAALKHPSWRVRTAAAHALVAHDPPRAADAIAANWGPVGAAPEEPWLIAWAMERAGRRDITALQGTASPDVIADLNSMTAFKDHDEFIHALRAAGWTPPLERVADQIWCVRQRPRFAPWYGASAGDELPTDPFRSAIQGLQYQVSYAAMAGRDKRELWRLFWPIRRALRSSHEAERAKGIEALHRIALSDPDEWRRYVSTRTLSKLGRVGAEPFFAALRGSSPVHPTAEQLARMSESPWTRYKPDAGELTRPETQEAMARFLAGEALGAFRDPVTLHHLVALATEPSPVAKRAAMVLADIEIDFSLPPLFWAAINDVEVDDRQRAKELLIGIVNKEPQYDIHFHKLTSVISRVNADLRWLVELVASSRSCPAWAASDSVDVDSWIRDPDATRRVIGTALRLVQITDGEYDIVYADATRWDVFKGLERRFREWGVSRQPETITRYPAFAFPARCRPGIPVVLKIRLDVAATRESAAPMSFPAQPERDTRLLAVVRAAGWSVEPPFASLPVPLNAPSPEIQFTLTPHDPGAQIVEVSFFRDAERVGYYCLTTNVVSWALTKGRADVHTIDTPQNRDLQRRGITRAVVGVNWGKDGTLDYTFLDPANPSAVPQPVGSSPQAVPRGDVARWTGKQGEIIKSFVEHDLATEADLAGAISSLVAVGCTLFDQLGTDPLRAAIRSLPDNAIVAIESNESWIPWELLADSPDGPLWGERLQIVRAPRLLASEDAAELDDAPAIDDAPGAAPVQRILSVVGDGIRQGAGAGLYQGAAMFGAPAAIVSEVVEGTAADVKAGAADADLVHFTCHGYSEPYYYLSLGPGAGRRLLTAQVKQLQLKPGAVVFANACSSDRAQLWLTELESLGWNFYLQGARPFIGTLGPVPVKHAVELAKEFYFWFLSRGLPAGQAMRTARAEIRRRSNNPFFLFYSLYGPASISRRLPN